MRELLQQAQAGSISHPQELNSPQRHRDQPETVRRASASVSSCTHQHENPDILTVQGSTGYANGHPYHGTLLVASPNEVSTRSHYEPSNAENMRPLKRKRSCFEIRDDAIADFIDKGLITAECAVSCFNSYVGNIPGQDALISSSFQFLSGMCEYSHAGNQEILRQF